MVVRQKEKEDIEAVMGLGVLRVEVEREGRRREKEDERESRWCQRKGGETVGDGKNDCQWLFDINASQLVI